MFFEALTLERSDEGYAIVTFNRPDKLNTLSIALRRELGEVVDACEADRGISVLVLTAGGRAFSAGLDLDEWASPEGVAAAAYVHDPVASIRRFSGPVIGAINGLCLTGGLELALACDLLVASREARFGDTHVKVGLLPGWGGSVRLARRIGLARAKEMAMTARFVGADEALAWGLVDHVVAAEQLRPAAEALAREMAAAGERDSLARYKRLLDEEADVTFSEALKLEREASRQGNVGVTREEIDARLARLRRQNR